MLISNPLKKCITIKVQKLCIFSPFSTVYKSYQPYNFLRVNFLDVFSTDSKLTSNSAFFYIPVANICGVILAYTYQKKRRATAIYCSNIRCSCLKYSFFFFKYQFFLIKYVGLGRFGLEVQPHHLIYPQHLKFYPQHL